MKKLHVLTLAFLALSLTSCNDSNNIPDDCNDCDVDTPIVCEGNECDDDPPVDCEGDDCDDNPVDCEGDECDDDPPVVCENNCGDIPVIESLAWTKWKYVGVGDVETGILTELVPSPYPEGQCVGCNRPTADCHTLTFSDIAVFGRFVLNTGGSYYYADYTTHAFSVTEFGMTLVNVVGCREYVFSELNRATSFSLQENELKIYYDESKFLLFEPFEVNSLIGTKWKLLGIMDRETCSLQELEPKPNDCDLGFGCGRNGTYSLDFISDTRFRFFSSMNELHFNYDANYTTHHISIQERDGGSIRIDEIGDGDLLLDILPSVSSFSFEGPHGHRLRLYYNECNNYLLFGIHF